MTDAVYVEMPMEQPPRRPFWKTRKGLILIAVIAIVILAGIFSWWLAQGKISSVQASLDTVVSTVEPRTSIQLSDILVQRGELVSAGQPLARVEPASLSPRKAEPQPIDLDRASRELTDKLKQARLEEEKYRRAWQDAVGEHVRTQLIMRSIDMRNRDAYSRAEAAVSSAKARADAAMKRFEQVSRWRAAMDLELGRMKSRPKSAMRAQPQEQTQTSAEPEYLYAPVGGQIVRVNGEQGQTVVQGMPVFFILPEGDSQYWIRAAFPAEDREKLKVGQTVNIRFENQGVHVMGKVAEIMGDAQAGRDPQTGMIALSAMNGGENPEKYIITRIALDDPEQVKSLPPGSRADCQIQTRYFFGL